ncbi:MAG: alpha/beta hydrolase [Eubacteriales bacterium]|nr:alpha/beta hydrolase [Eubacteriales bacterium]
MERYFDINKPGYSIKCKLYCEQIREIQHVVVFLHGFGGHKDNKTAARFAEAAMSKFKKMAVLAFDWPCHGSDVRKKLTLEDCGIYLDYVLEYIREELHVTDICAYATSFGGYLTLKYLHEKGNPFRKIAFRCPAVMMYDAMSNRIMTEENRRLLEKGKEAQVGFDRTVKVDQDFVNELREQDVREMEFLDFADDLLVIQGTKDEILPYEEVMKFCDDNVIECILIEDADHRFQDLQKLKLAHSHIIQFFAAR